VLKEHAAGLSAADLCRKHGISDATFYKWRSRFGGMEVSDARKLKALEEENRRLKKLLADTCRPRSRATSADCDPAGWS
jgi:putative transposase